MSKITNVCLTWSGTGCFIAVPIWQQWVLCQRVKTMSFYWSTDIPGCTLHLHLIYTSRHRSCSEYSCKDQYWTHMAGILALSSLPCTHIADILSGALCIIL